MYLQDIVAENIRKRRVAMGLTRRGLASLMGAYESSKCISRWESGQGVPTAFNLCLLADIFGCTVDELLGRVQ